MKPTKRGLWKKMESLSTHDGMGDAFDVTSEVVTVTNSDPEPVNVPEGATLLETKSDVVTVWATDV